MTQTILSYEPDQVLDAPENATRTSDYEISEEARDAFAAAVVEALEQTDDVMIALEIRVRESRDTGDRTELMDFIREQGYDPADLEP